MDKKLTDSRKYVAELVWLPTYVVVAIIVLASVENNYLVTVVMLVSLIGTRIILEIIFRFVFGERRLHIKTGIIAFLCQVVVWATVWWWLVG